jgi:hypothetical protein
MSGTKWWRRGRHDEQLHIVTADVGLADTEHVLLAAAVAQERLTLDDANSIGAKLGRPATFLWKDGGLT